MAAPSHLIPPSELHQKRSIHPGLTLLDVRTPAEYAEVHVPGAVNLPLGSWQVPDLERSGTVTRSQPVYLLCHSGQRAQAAAGHFVASGFDQVFVVTGGTAAWAEAGLPVNRGPRRAISLERQVRIGAGSLVLTGVILGFAWHPGWFGLSGFVGAGLIFAGVTDFCGMGLLLAKAPWNR